MPLYSPTLGLLGFSLLGTLTLGLALQRPGSVEAQGNFRELNGTKVRLEGKDYPVPWRYFQVGGQTRLGLSDIGAMDLLGLTLLDSAQPQSQPVQWFSTEILKLSAQWAPPYRYLDLTDLLPGAEAQGDTLVLAPTGAAITQVRQGQQPWGRRIVVELSRPAFWQISQTGTEGAVLLNASAPSQLISGTSGETRAPKPQDEDNLGGGGAVPNNPSFRLESAGNNSKLLVPLPPGYKLQVSSLANPYRLVIDVRADTPQPRTIVWAPGITWRQEWVTLPTGRFTVTSLDLDLQTAPLALQILRTNPAGAQGLAPMTTLARGANASAGINAGFFNRQTQLPLGALKQSGQWLSGPILNRGAVAWDDQGGAQFGRLTLQETVTTTGGQRVNLTALNSGYVQKGAARYTPDWGAVYIPLTDNETVTGVEDGAVVFQQSAGKAGQNQVTIPPRGYLLTHRGGAASPWQIGDRLTLTSETLPPSFNRYPQILGAGPLLIAQGKIALNAEAEKFNPQFQNQKASRSALGQRRPGQMSLVAAHNRQGGPGATLGEWAQILKAMGMTSALNLDGGSSTSLVLGGQLVDRSPVTAARVSNGLGVFWKSSQSPPSSSR